MSIFESGEHITLYADIMPAYIIPAPEGVPTGRKLRAVITDKKLIIAWLNGAVNGQPDIGFWKHDVTDAAVNFQGGTIDGYTVKRGSGCACGSAGLKSWNPFEGAFVVRNFRGLPSNAPDSLGLVRYTRF